MTDMIDFKEQLGPDELHWFADALVGMAWADGELKAEEIKKLLNELSFLGDKTKIKKYVQDHTVFKEENGIAYPVLPQFDRLKIDMECAFWMLLYLGYMAISDGDFSETEILYLIYLGEKLGIDQQKIAELNKWLKSNLSSAFNSEDIQKKIIILYKTVRGAKPNYPTQADAVYAKAQEQLKALFMSGQLKAKIK